MAPYSIKPANERQDARNVQESSESVFGSVKPPRVREPSKLLVPFRGWQRQDIATAEAECVGVTVMHDINKLDIFEFTTKWNELEPDWDDVLKQVCAAKSNSKLPPLMEDQEVEDAVLEEDEEVADYEDDEEVMEYDCPPVQSTTWWKNNKPSVHHPKFLPPLTPAVRPSVQPNYRFPNIGLKMSPFPNKATSLPFVPSQQSPFFFKSRMVQQSDNATGVPFVPPQQSPFCFKSRMVQQSENVTGVPSVPPQQSPFCFPDRSTRAQNNDNNSSMSLASSVPSVPPQLSSPFLSSAQPLPAQRNDNLSNPVQAHPVRALTTIIPSSKFPNTIVTSRILPSTAVPSVPPTPAPIASIPVQKNDENVVIVKPTSATTAVTPKKHVDGNGNAGITAVPTPKSASLSTSTTAASQPPVSSKKPLFFAFRDSDLDKLLDSDEESEEHIPVVTKPMVNRPHHSVRREVPRRPTLVNLTEESAPSTPEPMIIQEEQAPVIEEEPMEVDTSLSSSQPSTITPAAVVPAKEQNTVMVPQVQMESLSLANSFNEKAKETTNEPGPVLSVDPKKLAVPFQKQKQQQDEEEDSEEGEEWIPVPVKYRSLPPSILVQRPIQDDQMNKERTASELASLPVCQPPEVTSSEVPKKLEDSNLLANNTITTPKVEMRKPLVPASIALKSTSSTQLLPEKLKMPESTTPAKTQGVQENLTKELSNRLMAKRKEMSQGQGVLRLNSTKQNTGQTVAGMPNMQARLPTPQASRSTLGASRPTPAEKQQAHSGQYRDPYLPESSKPGPSTSYAAEPVPRPELKNNGVRVECQEQPGNSSARRVTKNTVTVTIDGRFACKSEIRYWLEGDTLDAIEYQLGQQVKINRNTSEYLDYLIPQKLNEYLRNSDPNQAPIADVRREPQIEEQAAPVEDQLEYNPDIPQNIVYSDYIDEGLIPLDEEDEARQLHAAIDRSMREARAPPSRDRQEWPQRKVKVLKNKLVESRKRKMLEEAASYDRDDSPPKQAALEPVVVPELVSIVTAPEISLNVDLEFRNTSMDARRSSTTLREEELVLLSLSCEATPRTETVPHISDTVVNSQPSSSGTSKHNPIVSHKEFEVPLPVSRTNQRTITVDSSSDIVELDNDSESAGMHLIRATAAMGINEADLIRHDRAPSTFSDESSLHLSFALSSARGSVVPTREQSVEPMEPKPDREVANDNRSCDSEASFDFGDLDVSAVPSRSSTSNSRDDTSIMSSSAGGHAESASFTIANAAKVVGSLTISTAPSAPTDSAVPSTSVPLLSPRSLVSPRPKSSVRDSLRVKAIINETLNTSSNGDDISSLSQATSEISLHSTAVAANVNSDVFMFTEPERLITIEANVIGVASTSTENVLSNDAIEMLLDPEADQADHSMDDLNDPSMEIALDVTDTAPESDEAPSTDVPAKKTRISKKMLNRAKADKRLATIRRNKTENALKLANAQGLETGAENIDPAEAPMLSSKPSATETVTPRPKKVAKAKLKNRRVDPIFREYQGWPVRSYEEIVGEPNPFAVINLSDSDRGSVESPSFAAGHAAPAKHLANAPLVGEASTSRNNEDYIDDGAISRITFSEDDELPPADLPSVSKDPIARSRMDDDGLLFSPSSLKEQTMRGGSRGRGRARGRVRGRGSRGSRGRGASVNTTTMAPDLQSAPPIKRGRGRPRKVDANARNYQLGSDISEQPLNSTPGGTERPLFGSAHLKNEPITPRWSARKPRRTVEVAVPWVEDRPCTPPRASSPRRVWATPKREPSSSPEPTCEFNEGHVFGQQLIPPLPSIVDEPTFDCYGLNADLQTPALPTVEEVMEVDAMAVLTASTAPSSILGGEEMAENLQNQNPSAFAEFATPFRLTRKRSFDSSIISVPVVFGTISILDTREGSLQLPDDDRERSASPGSDRSVIVYTPPPMDPEDVDPDCHIVSDSAKTPKPKILPDRRSIVQTPQVETPNRTKLEEETEILDLTRAQDELLQPAVEPIRDIVQADRPLVAHFDYTDNAVLDGNAFYPYAPSDSFVNNRMLPPVLRQLFTNNVRVFDKVPETDDRFDDIPEEFYDIFIEFAPTGGIAPEDIEADLAIAKMHEVNSQIGVQAITSTNLGTIVTSNKIKTLFESVDKKMSDDLWEMIKDVAKKAGADIIPIEDLWIELTSNIKYQLYRSFIQLAHASKHCHLTRLVNDYACRVLFETLYFGWRHFLMSGGPLKLFIRLFGERLDEKVLEAAKKWIAKCDAYLSNLKPWLRLTPDDRVGALALSVMEPEMYEALKADAQELPYQEKYEPQIESGRHECKLCKLTFSNEALLNAHKPMHDTSTATECPVCCADFLYVECMYLHLLESHPNDVIDN